MINSTEFWICFRSQYLEFMQGKLRLNVIFLLQGIIKILNIYFNAYSVSIKLCDNNVTTRTSSIAAFNNCYFILCPWGERVFCQYEINILRNLLKQAIVFFGFYLLNVSVVFVQVPQYITQIQKRKNTHSGMQTLHSKKFPLISD